MQLKIWIFSSSLADSLRVRYVRECI